MIDSVSSRVAPRTARALGALAVAVVAAALLVGVLLTRPDDPDQPQDRSERQAAALTKTLGRPPGAAAVDVGAGRDVRGNPYVATVVSLDRAATADQVADVVSGLPADVRRAGLPGSYAYRQLTFLGASGARLTVGWEPALDVAAVRAAAAAWLAVDHAVGDRADVAAIVLTGGRLDYRLALGSTPAADLLGVYRDASTASSTADSGSTGWELSGTAGATDLRLASFGLLDQARQDEWTALVAATDRLGGGLAASRLDVSFGNRVEAHLAVVAPDSVADADFTPAAYGAQVLPSVQPQLATLSAAGDHWSYFLSLAHSSRPDAEQLLALLFGDQGTVSDGTGPGDSPDTPTGWGQATRALLTAAATPRQVARTG